MRVKATGIQRCLWSEVEGAGEGSELPLRKITVMAEWRRGRGEEKGEAGDQPASWCHSSGLRPEGRCCSKRGALSEERRVRERWKEGRQGRSCLRLDMAVEESERGARLTPGGNPE